MSTMLNVQHKNIMNYASYVDIANIVIDDEKIGNESFRYSLSIPFKSGGIHSLLAIMMNPAQANKYVSDLTINRVIEYARRQNRSYSKVTIANLYPVYEQYSEYLRLHEKQVNLNLSKVTDLISTNDDVLLGWGKPYKINQKRLHEIKYHHMARKVIAILIENNSNTYIAGDLRDDLYPRHLGRVSYDFEMKRCDLEGLIKKVDIQIKSDNEKFDQL